MSERERRGRVAGVFSRLWREKPLGTASGIVILILIVVASLADVLAPYPFAELNLPDRLQGASARHLLGTEPCSGTGRVTRDGLPWTMRLTRTMMLEVLRQDYIRTAWSKGLKERVIIIRHAIKNAFIPILTLIGMQLPLLVGGSVILEEIFVLPGIGRMFVAALNARDYPVVSAINLLLASVVLLSTLLIDMLYPYLDPRIRYK